MKVADLKKLPKKILIYSRAGMGKSALAATLGERAHIVDMDGNLDVVFGLDDELKEERLKVDVKQFLDDFGGNKATAFLKAKKYIYGIAADIKNNRWPFDVFVLDSLTSLSMAAQDYIMSNAGRLGKNPQIQEWGLILTEIENVITRIRAMNKLAIILAHEMTFKSEDHEEVQIMIPGQKLPARLTRMFSEIWYLRVQRKGEGKQDMYIHTIPTASIVARSGSGVQTGTRFATIDKHGRPKDSVSLWTILQQLESKEPEPVK